jgi:hypothetical protein
MDILNPEIFTGRAVWLTASALFVAIASVNFLFRSNPGGKLPLHGAEYGIYPRRVMRYMYHAQSMYLQGYVKFRNSVYRITTADGG